MKVSHQNKATNTLKATEDQKKIFNNKSKKTSGFEDKTLWDKLNLFGALAIPLIIALATIGFGLLQIHLADVQHQQDQQQVLDQQQATTLQTYIDNIQDLLLNHNLLESSSVDTSNPYYDVAILAQARTLTALQDLDPVRKGRLLTFLYEAKLIGYFDSTNHETHDVIISLLGANLREANLYNISPFTIDLSGIDLSDADLSDADLSSVIFFNAELAGAILQGTQLSYDNLTGADLTGDDLTGADLTGADLTQQQLDKVHSCKGAILPTGLICHHNQ